MGYCGLYPLTLHAALQAVDYNALMMIAGTMGIVSLFIESKMPARLSEILISHVPNVKWAIAALALFAGLISAFVDNVATVLMVAPVGLEIARRMKVSPVPVLIAISVSSNLQGAATLVGDTTSILLGNFAGINFLDFFWMEGRPGIFWSVELGAIASALVLLLICASFFPAPAQAPWAQLYPYRSGLICGILCLIGVLRACLHTASLQPLRTAAAALDTDTLLLLFGLFLVIAGIQAARLIDAAADLLIRVSDNRPFLLYSLILVASVVLSAFIDNIPYVATMLPVVQSAAAMLDFLRIGIPFTLAAVSAGYLYLWFVWCV